MCQQFHNSLLSRLGKIWLAMDCLLTGLVILRSIDYINFSSHHIALHSFLVITITVTSKNTCLFLNTWRAGQKSKLDSLNPNQGVRESLPKILGEKPFPCFAALKVPVLSFSNSWAFSTSSNVLRTHPV